VDSVREPLEEPHPEQPTNRLVTSALDAALAVDEEGAVIEFSSAAEELFGIARADAIGHDLVELVVPAELREDVRYCLAGGAGEPPQGPDLVGRRIELPARRGDGTEFRAELTVVRAADPGGGMTAFARDVSDRIATERAHAYLAEVVKGSQDAVLSKDLDGVITSWNPAAERLYGYTAEEAIGRHISLIVPEHLEGEVDEILARVRRGELFETYETQRCRKDRTLIDVSLTISAIGHPGSGLSGASVIARDISAERRQRRARDFLIAATRDLDASLDPIETARNIVAKAVPELAEVCLIDFVRPDGRIGDSVAAAAVPEAATRLEEIRRTDPLDPDGMHPVAQVLREGEPMIWRNLAEPATEEQFVQSEEHRQLVRETGYSSAAVVGLVARGRKIGALSFLHTGDNPRYDDLDLEFLGELGDRAALALDNAQLYQERDAIARNLQRGLRPPRPAPVPGLESSVVFEAAGRGIEIGGDLYDVLPTDDGCWVLVGDVAGKGSAAAGVSVAVRHAVRGLTREVEEPEEVLTRVNELLLEGTGLNDFATAVLVRLRAGREGWTMATATAGHPPPVHVHDGSSTMLGGGSVLGAWENAPPRRHDAAFDLGDTLVLCTDGWLEAGSSDQHRAPEELAELAKRLAPLDLAEMTARLRSDVISRSEGSLRDDVVVLALRRTGE
jgi:PAS domain S-box-containing protein